MATSRRATTLLVVFAVIASPDATGSRLADDSVGLYWSYKNSERLGATAISASLHGNGSVPSFTLPFSNDRRQSGGLDTLVNIFDGSQLSRMKRSPTTPDDNSRVVFGGSIRIVEGYMWSEDLLFSNTSFYRDLEAQVVYMLDHVFESTSVAQYYAGASVIQFSYGSIIVHFTVSFTMDPDNGTTAGDSALTGPNITRLFLEAASNMSSNYSLDTNSTELLEILVSTDSPYTTNAWTALLSTDLQLMSDSSDPKDYSVSSSFPYVTSASYSGSTAQSWSSEREQSSSSGSEVQGPAGSNINTSSSSSFWDGESSKAHELSFAESYQSTSLSSYTSLAAHVSMSEVVISARVEASSPVVLQSMETSSVALPATSPSRSSASTEGYNLSHASTILVQNVTSSLYNPPSSRFVLDEAFGTVSSPSLAASSVLSEYSSSVSTSVTFSPDHIPASSFAPEASEKYVSFSSPEVAVSQGFQVTPGLSPSHVLPQATSFDLELILMPISSGQAAENTEKLLEVSSSVSGKTATVSLDVTVISSLMLQEDSSPIFSEASRQVPLNTSQPTLVLESVSLHEAYTTVKSQLNVSVIPSTSSLSFESVTENLNTTRSLHYTTSQSSTLSYLAADVTQASFPAEDSSLVLDFQRHSSLFLYSVSSTSTFTEGSSVPVIPSLSQKSTHMVSVTASLSQQLEDYVTSTSGFKWITTIPGLSLDSTWTQNPEVSSSVVPQDTQTPRLDMTSTAFLETQSGIRTEVTSSRGSEDVRSESLDVTSGIVVTSSVRTGAASSAESISPSRIDAVSTSSIRGLSASSTVSAAKSSSSLETESASGLPATVGTSPSAVAVEITSSTGYEAKSSAGPFVIFSAIPSVISSAGPFVTSSAIPSVISSAGPFVTSSEIPSVISSAGPFVISSAIPSVISSAGPFVTSSAAPVFTSSAEGDAATTSAGPLTISNAGLLVASSAGPFVTSSAGQILTSSTPASVITRSALLATSNVPLEITSSSIPETTFSRGPSGVLSTPHEDVSTTGLEVTSTAGLADTSSTSYTAMSRTSSAGSMPTSTVGPVVTSAGMLISSSAGLLDPSSAGYVITSASPLTLSSAGPGVTSAEMTVGSSVGTLPTANASSVGTSASLLATSTTGSTGASDTLLEVTSDAPPTTLSAAGPFSTSGAGLLATSSPGLSVTSSTAPLAASSIVLEVTSSVRPVVISSASLADVSSPSHAVTSSVLQVTSSAVPGATSSIGSEAITSRPLGATSSRGLETSHLIMETESSLGLKATVSTFFSDIPSSREMEGTMSVFSDATLSVHSGATSTLDIFSSMEAGIAWNRTSEVYSGLGLATISSSIPMAPVSPSVYVTWSLGSISSVLKGLVDVTSSFTTSSFTRDAASTVSPGPDTSISLDFRTASSSSLQSTSLVSESSPSSKADVKMTSAIGSFEDSILTTASSPLSSAILQQQLTAIGSPSLTATSAHISSLEQQVVSSQMVPLKSLSEAFSFSTIDSTSTLSPLPTISVTESLSTSASSLDFVKELAASSGTFDALSSPWLHRSDFPSTPVYSSMSPSGFSFSSEPLSGSTSVFPEASILSVSLKGMETAMWSDTVFSMRETASLDSVLSYSSVETTSSSTVPYSSTVGTSSDSVLYSSSVEATLSGSVTSSSPVLYYSSVGISSGIVLYSSTVKTSGSLVYSSSVEVTDSVLYSSSVGTHSSLSLHYSSVGTTSSEAVLYSSTVRATSLSPALYSSSVEGTSSASILYSSVLYSSYVVATPSSPVLYSSSVGGTSSDFVLSSSLGAVSSSPALYSSSVGTTSSGVALHSSTVGTTSLSSVLYSGSMEGTSSDSVLYSTSVETISSSSVLYSSYVLATSPLLYSSSVEKTSAYSVLYPSSVGAPLTSPVLYSSPVGGTSSDSVLYSSSVAAASRSGLYLSSVGTTLTSPVLYSSSVRGTSSDSVLYSSSVGGTSSDSVLYSSSVAVASRSGLYLSSVGTTLTSPVLYSSSVGGTSSDSVLYSSSVAAASNSGLYSSSVGIIFTSLVLYSSSVGITLTSPALHSISVVGTSSDSALYSSSMAASSSYGLYSSSVGTALTSTALYSSSVGGTSSEYVLYFSNVAAASSGPVLYSSAVGGISSSSVLYSSASAASSGTVSTVSVTSTDTVLHSSSERTLSSETVSYPKLGSLFSVSSVESFVDVRSDIQTTKVFQGTSDVTLPSGSSGTGAYTGALTLSSAQPTVSLASDVITSATISMVYQGAISSFPDNLAVQTSSVHLPGEMSSVWHPASSEYSGIAENAMSASTSDTTTTTRTTTTATSTTSSTSTSKPAQISTPLSQALEPSTLIATTATPGPTQTTASADDGGTKTFQGIMRVVDGASFSEDLLDKSSDAYRQLEAEIMAFIKQVLQECGLSQKVGNIQITGFSSGSVIVVFTVDIIHVSNSDISEVFIEGYQSLNQTDYVLDTNYTEVRELQENQSSRSSQPALVSVGLTPSSSFAHSTSSGNTATAALQSATFASSVVAGSCSCGTCADRRNCSYCDDASCSTTSAIAPSSTAVAMLDTYSLRQSTSAFSPSDASIAATVMPVDPCGSASCPPHSQCQSAGYSFVCTCDPGYSKQNDRCVDIDECLSNPCPENSVCTNTAGDFFCFCRSGFAERDGRCEDVDECASGLCPLHSNCTNSNGSFFCNCSTGYELSHGSCINVDECLSSPCSVKATCVDNVGSFSCECLQGYVAENNSCSDIDECADAHVCTTNAECHNTDGSYTCKCMMGFEDKGGLCVDVDECSTNPCPLHSECANYAGGFDCQCTDGFYNNSKECLDVNECQDPVTSPCQQHAVCANLPGSFQCRCLVGFLQQGNDCKDVNECAVISACPTLSDCQNTEGNYSCVCRKELFQADPYTCKAAKTFELIFPSRVYTDNLTIQAGADLQKTLTGQFYGITRYSENKRLFLRLSTNYTGGCVVLRDVLGPLFDSISSNYTLYNQTSLDVIDVDECSESNWTDCSATGSSCRNAAGSYTCACSAGFVDYSTDANRPGRLCLAIDNYHQQPIKGLAIVTRSSTVTSSKSKFQVGDNVTFSLSVAEGSHVTFRVQYGDGGLDTLVHPNVISFMSPVTLNHAYKQAGLWTVVANASNANSYTVGSAKVTVIEPVRSLALNKTEMSQSPVSKFLFTVAVLDVNLTLSDMACSFDFGDGQTQTVAQDTMTKESPISTTHVYNLGVFNVSVLCSNNISAMSLNSTATAEEVITGLKVSASKAFVRVGEVFYLTVETAAGSNIVLQVDLGNGRQETYTLGNNKRGSSVMQLPVKYSQVGRYALLISVKNLLSRDAIRLANEIRVLNIVKDLVLVSPGLVAYPPGSVNITLTYGLSSSPPTDVSCEVIAEHLPPSVYAASEISSSSSLTLPLYFTDASAVGVNNVTVNCSNPLSYQVLHADVLLQAVIEDVGLAVSQTYIMVRGAVDVSVSVGFGSHAQYLLDFGDGSSFSGAFASTVIENKTLSLRHAFERAGLYALVLRVFNRVSNATARATVVALEEVTGVSLSAWYQPLDTNDTLRGGHGDRGDIFPLERDVVVVVGLGSGNDITYAWTFGDGSQNRTRDKQQRHAFQAPGQYRVSVNASNALFYGTASVVVTVHQTVLMHTLTNNGPTDAYRTIRFTLALARLGTASCFLWDMGDGSEGYVFGEAHCSQYTSIRADKFARLPDGQTTSVQLVQEHVYRTNDTFQVTVLAYNQVSDGRIVNVAVISGVSCHYPQVRVAGGGQQIDKPVTHLKSEWIFVESTVDINCQVTQEADYIWKAEKVLTGNNFLDFKFELVSVDSISAGLFKILYTAGAFELGTYRISLNVSMRGIPGLFQSDFTYLRIDPSPLVAYILGGSSRTVGYDKIFPLDALSDSYDPDRRDFKDKSGLVFQWYCRGAGENLPDNPPVIVIPTNVSQADFAGKGGCFGTGPGKLPAGGSGYLQVDSFFLGYMSTVVFTVEVRKDSRVSIYTQAVKVVVGDPPQLNIECVTNCNSKVNPSGEFAVLVRCLQCRDMNKVVFQWSLFLERDGMLTPVTIPDNATSTGLRSPGISFKSSYLTGGLTYRLRADGLQEGYAPGFTEYRFLTNLPPYGGNCWIFPQEGFALDTLFVINCSGWLNPGEETSYGRGLIYRFWISPPGQSNQLLYYGTDPFTPQSKLPLGLEEDNFLYDVTVRIANPIGEYIQQVLKVKVSRPAVMQSVDSFLNLTLGGTSRLSMFLATGREQEAKQMIVALASLLNTEVVTITKTTATTATTTRSSSTARPATYTTQRATITQSAFSSLATTPTNQSSLRSTTTTGAVGITVTAGKTTEPTTTAQTTTERSTEEKQKLTELRTQVVKSLAKTTALTLDSLQQTARAVKVITDQTDEISEECQRITVGTIADITDSLSSMVAEERTQSVEQERNTAGDIVATLGNLLLAATNGVKVEDVAVLTWKDSNANSGFANVVTTSANVSTPSASPPSSSWSPAGTSTAPPQSTAAQSALNKREQVRKLTQETMALADVVAKTVLQRQVPGAPPVVLPSRLFTLTVARNSLAAFNNSVHTSQQGSFAFPSSQHFPVTNTTSFLDTQFVTSSKNPFIWDASAKQVTSPVLSMTVYDELGSKMSVSNLSQPIRIEILTGRTQSDPVHVTPFLTGDAGLYYHVIDPQWNVTQALSIDLKPEDRRVTLEAFFKWGSSPTVTDFDFYRKIAAEEADVDGLSSVFIRSDEADNNETELLYMGVRKYVNASLLEADYSDYYVDDEATGVRNESLPPYTVVFFTSTCRFWDEQQETWSTNGCQVSDKSSPEVTQCLCTHLTSFASGVVVAPNAIHFDTVFVNLDNKIADNFSVLLALCLAFGLYAVGLVWARRMDRKDVERWGATLLADNVITDKYFYKLTVFTGMRSGAGTRSRVSFILAGDYSDTGVRQLVDETGKKTLSRGSINQYILGVPDTLGSLMYLRFWHDNSGKGRHQGWYLSKVIVTDLQAGTSYIFLCNRWLAVEEDDGKVDRMLPVAGREDLVDFQHLFFSETKRLLSDTHLWLSVFSRPRRSSFSRVQRLSCILCLLLATMMADAMFYQANGDTDAASGGLEIGPVKVTLRELYVSFVSSLIILPLNVLIDQLFRRSRPRESKCAVAAAAGQAIGPPPFASETGEDPDVSKLFQVVGTPQDSHPADPLATAGAGPPGKEPCQNPGDEEAEKGDGAKGNSAEAKVTAGRVKVMLPRACVYVAWLLVLAVSGVSAFIIFSYSMEWGRDKSIAWLTAMLLSVGQSITLIQPVKILVQALLLAWACKKPTDQDNDVEADEPLDTSHVQLMSDEEAFGYMPKMARRPHVTVPSPDPEVLNSCRERRLKELAMQRVIIEIVAYLSYLVLLTLVARSNSDTCRFLWTSSIRNILNAGPAVEEVRQADDFWNWAQTVMVPYLYPETDWGGQPLNYGDGRVVSSLDAYRVGPVRLRQHRVTTDACAIPRPFLPSQITCTQTWSWESEDTGAYSAGWQVPAEDFASQINSPWTHQDWTQTDGIPYVGAVSAYPAGGYIKDLIGRKERVVELLHEMQAFQWLDKRTRSVFVEFILYNPNVNLFALVTVVFETPMTGSLQGSVIVSPFRLFSYIGGDGVLAAISESLVVVWTLYFLVREGRKLGRERAAYLRKFWNWIELGTLVGSVTAIVMYTGRYLLTLAAMKKVKALRGKYYNFQRLALWNELFSYVLAFVTFLAVLKTMHLLRFNRRLSMLGSTLLRAATDLLSFSIVFSLVFIAFTAAAFLLFCSLLPEYSTFVKALETLLAVSLGQSEFQVLQEANFIIGPVFCFLYILFVVFMLLNMFVTILNETFAVVRRDLTQQSNDYEIVDFMWNRFWEWLGASPFRLSGGNKETYISRGGKADASVRQLRDSLDDVGKGSLTTMSVLHVMLRHLEADFDGLGSGPPRYLGPGLKVVPGYTSLDADTFSLGDDWEAMTDNDKKEA